ncbi:MAG: DUF2142 domain-containing protein [Marmoricola sp.]
MNRVSTPVRTALLAGAGLLLVQLGWILSVIPGFGIDEFDHALRASSVAAGHWEPGHDLVTGKAGRGDLIPVRSDVARTIAPACKARSYTGPYNCTPKTDLGDGTVLIASAASRYNPVFYAYAGTLAKPFGGQANLLAMRVATALAACVLFMLTVWLAVSGARTRWPLVGCLVAALPTTVYSTAIASPNGIEMIAGLGFWVAALALVRGPRGAQRRASAYAIAGLCAATTANTHTLGMLWLGLIVTAVALLHGPGRTVRALLPVTRLERAVAAATALAISFELVWLLVSGANDPTQEHTVFRGNPVPYTLTGALLWPLQAIGAFPMRDENAPMALYALALLVLGLIATLTVRRLALRSRTALTLAFVASVSWLVPAVLTVYSFHQIGSAWQGRYGMPFSVGLIVVAAAVLDDSSRPPRRSRALVTLCVVAVTLTQLIGQLGVVAGEHRHTELVHAAGWHSPPVLLLVVLALGAGLCWYAGVRVSEPAPSDEAAESSRELVVA